MNDSLPIAKTPLHAMLPMLALSIILAGCRSNPYVANHIETLNAEKRALEDQLYELEYDYERVLAELEAARKELNGTSADTSRRSRNQRRESSGDDAGSNGNLPDLSPGTVSPGTPFEPKIEIPELPEPKDQGSASRRRETSQPISVNVTRLHPDDPWITHIHLDPLRTGGSDFDQQPGDDGLIVVFQPRNKSDEFVPLAGPVSIVALDYAKRDDGAAARIARWDLDAEQVDQLIEDNASEQGIVVRVAWAENVPTSSRLMIAVRYTTADGRKLEAKRDIFITLPGQFSQRWTPRSPSRRHDDESQEGINVARQPSLNDEASMTPRAATAQESQTHAASTGQPAAANQQQAERPLWRPYR